MENKFVICLGREYGSGGHNIGKLLAGMLGVDYYDKKLLDEAARKSGISEEYFERSDEKAPGSLTHTLASGLFAGGGGMFMYNNSLSSESIFQFQSEAILNLAAEKSCVIVGRCADYVLREHERIFSVFITAPMPDRVRRISHREDMAADKAREKAKKIDKIRKEYYDYYTNKRWGRAASYDLCIDSSVLGDEGTARYICDFIRRALEENRGKKE